MPACFVVTRWWSFTRKVWFRDSRQRMVLCCLVKDIAVTKVKELGCIKIKQTGRLKAFNTVSDESKYCCSMCLSAVPHATRVLVGSYLT